MARSLLQAAFRSQLPLFAPQTGIYYLGIGHNSHLPSRDVADVGADGGAFFSCRDYSSIELVVHVSVPERKAQLFSLIAAA